MNSEQNYTALKSHQIKTNPEFSDCFKRSGSSVFSELAIIDSRVPHLKQLINGLRKDVALIFVNKNQDVFDALENVLFRPSTIHIISHGEPGRLLVANRWIDQEDLYSNESRISAWASGLTGNPEIFLYGCRVAEGEVGAKFANTLSRITGCKVAASTSLTGASEFGGDWDLQFQSAPLSGRIALSVAAQRNWKGILAPEVSLQKMQ